MDRFDRDACALPFAVGDTTLSSLFVNTLLICGAASVWNIFSGYTGYLSLGLGAYTPAIVCNAWSIPGGFLPFCHAAPGWSGWLPLRYSTWSSSSENKATYLHDTYPCHLLHFSRAGKQPLLEVCPGVRAQRLAPASPGESSISLPKNAADSTVVS